MVKASMCFLFSVYALSHRDFNARFLHFYGTYGSGQWIKSYRKIVVIHGEQLTIEGSMVLASMDFLDSTSTAIFSRMVSRESKLGHR